MSYVLYTMVVFLRLYLCVHALMEHVPHVFNHACRTIPASPVLYATTPKPARSGAAQNSRKGFRASAAEHLQILESEAPVLELANSERSRIASARLSGKLRSMTTAAGESCRVFMSFGWRMQSSKGPSHANFRESRSEHHKGSVQRTSLRRGRETCSKSVEMLVQWRF